MEKHILVKLGETYFKREPDRELVFLPDDPKDSILRHILITKEAANGSSKKN